MRILHISYTHGFNRQLTNLPKTDIIIHSGDVSMAVSSTKVVDFIEWFGELDYRYKVFIGGNHDFSLDGKDRLTIQRFCQTIVFIFLGAYHFSSQMILMLIFLK
ncbi:MAG: metallophosphoesterase [Candidatus Saccharimonadaceae bacterium]